MSNELKGPSNVPVPPPSARAAGPNAAGVYGGVTGATAKPNKHDELRLLVNSRHPIITVETPEEERFEQMLLDVATELGVPFFEWSVTAGLSKYHGAAIYNTEQPEQALANIPLIQGDAIFLLKDFARYCENDRICRRLRDLAEKFRTTRRAIVISAASLQLPAELAAEAAPFELGLPTAEELLPGVKRVLAEANREQRIPVSLDIAGMSQAARNLSGLSEEEAMRTLRMCILSRGKADAGLLDDVLDAKRQVLRSDGLIESVRRDASFNDVAGLKRLREWIAKRKSALTAEGQRFGLEPPKGILITGVQGCGRVWRRALSRANGDLSWRGWMLERYTTSLWGRVKRSCTRRSSWRRSWRLWCCGSTRSRKRLLRQVRAVMRTRVCHNAFWQLC